MVSNFHSRSVYTHVRLATYIGPHMFVVHNIMAVFANKQKANLQSRDKSKVIVSGHTAEVQICDCTSAEEQSAIVKKVALLYMSAHKWLPILKHVG